MDFNIYSNNSYICDEPVDLAAQRKYKSFFKIIPELVDTLTFWQIGI